VFLNVGAGPLTRPLSRFFARSALRAADYVSFRDEDSRTLARRIGFEGASRVFPDSAYSLVSPGLRSIDANPDGGNASVGLAPMPYCDPRKFHEKDQVVYEAFIRKLGRFGSSLVRAGYAVALFGSDIGTDHLAIDDLQNAIVGDGAAAGASSRIERARVTTLDELLTAIAAMDYVVTCRFHGIVFAHLLNKPVLAVSHHPKMTALMSDIGLARYCVDIRTFEPDSLMKTFAAMVADGDLIRQRMAAKLAYNRDMLTRQLDELFPTAAPLVQPSRVAVGGSF
jgi:polysaccharide pyruvyl transferase WcaK-like protein